ncbi:glucose transporter type 1, partial [Lasius niger]
MADSRGFKPINQLWQSATVPDQDSECLYEEIPGLSGPQDTDQPAGAAVGHARRVQREEEEEEEEEEDENVGGSRGSLDFGVQVGGSGDWWGDHSPGGREDIVAGGGGTVPRSRTLGRTNGRSGSGASGGGGGGARSRSGSTDRRRPSDRARQQDIVVVGRVEEERYAARRIHVESGTGAVLPPPAATGLKLTRGRPTSQSTVARYLHSASTNASATHHHHHHHGSLHGQYPPSSGGRTTGRQHRHHHSSRGAFSNETQEEVQEDDEATLRELLV